MKDFGKLFAVSAVKLIIIIISGCKGLDYWQRLKKLDLMSLQRRRERYIILNMWKILNKKYPNNTNVEFHVTGRRGVVAKIPPLPKNCKQKHLTLYESSFSVLGPRLWNTLPAEITTIDDLDAFKRALYKRFLQKMPDKPPVKGSHGSQYARVNANSITDWKLDKTWCPDVIPLSGQTC